MDKCPHCNNIRVPPSLDVCPHCGRSLPPPNIRAANNPEEVSALDRRYKSAKSASADRGTEDIVKEFEAVLENSVAVIARPLSILERIVERDNAIYNTFYQMIEAESIYPMNDEWSFRREAADTVLFPFYKGQVRFAALSINALGLSNYGDCHITLRSKMIAHRATVFEENSTLFMKHHDIKVWDAGNLPRGYRAIWEDRAKLCVAKLYPQITLGTKSNEFPELLLKAGATTEDDEFIEVHIWGPMTIHTIERILISSSLRGRRRDTILKALKYKLAKYGVPIS